MSLKVVKEKVVRFASFRCTTNQYADRDATAPAVQRLRHIWVRDH